MELHINGSGLKDDLQFHKSHANMKKKAYAERGANKKRQSPDIPSTRSFSDIQIQGSTQVTTSGHFILRAAGRLTGLVPWARAALLAVLAISLLQAGAAAALILSATQTGNTITITWTSLPGWVYQVQDTTASLGSLSHHLGAWNNLGPAIPASAGPTTTASFTPGPDPAHFYRVLGTSQPFIPSASASYTDSGNNGTPLFFTNGNYVSVVFLANGTFTILNGEAPIESLVVAGGGGGGEGYENYGGGGGAGGLVHTTFSPLYGPGNYSVIVGAGGEQDDVSPDDGQGNGGNSAFNQTEVVAVGGGRGWGYEYLHASTSGGSGGGGVGHLDTYGNVDIYSAGGPVPPGQGNGGGAGYASYSDFGLNQYQAGGGGGGAGGPGGDAGAGTAGKGGSGVYIALTGNVQFDSYYAGGGGYGVDNGTTFYATGLGGSGGGGQAGSNGSPNSGGGAGSCFNAGSETVGGSGIVILKYRLQ